MSSNETTTDAAVKAEAALPHPPARLSAEELLERARAGNTGKRPWQLWKSMEAGEVVNLFEWANRQSRRHAGADADRLPPRVELYDVCLAGDLNMVYRVHMPVPLWPVAGKLRVGTSAVFHLTYREEWRWESPAGWEPLGLFEPMFDIFHPNAAPALRGAICLGGKGLPPGISPKELVLMGYYALALQNYVLDETDPHGVLNVEACSYFRSHNEYLPLTHAGLADPWQPPEAETEIVKIQ
jgi:hypothetical protein